MKSTPGLWMVLLIAGVCGACSRTSRAQDSGRVSDTSGNVTAPAYKAPTLPSACRREPTRLADLKACVDSLHFDSLDVVGDEQRLMLNPPCPGPCRYGPLAKIEPEVDAHNYSQEDLREGRIIARLFLSGPEKTSYRKLGMVSGQITYWWVQRIPNRPGNDGRSIYITVSGGNLVKKDFPLKYEEYRGAIKQALARWLWEANDEKTQGTCGSGTCK